MTSPAPTALEVGELRALLVGREPPEVVHRLADITERLAAGQALEDDDRSLVARVRHEYGHELAGLADPES